MRRGQRQSEYARDKARRAALAKQRENGLHGLSVAEVQERAAALFGSFDPARAERLAAMRGIVKDAYERIGGGLIHHNGSPAGL